MLRKFIVYIFFSFWRRLRVALLPLPVRHKDIFSIRFAENEFDRRSVRDEEHPPQ